MTDVTNNASRYLILFLEMGSPRVTYAGLERSALPA